MKLKQNYNTDTAEGKVKFMTEAAKLLSNLDNRIESDVYAGKLCEETGVDRKSFDNQISRYIRSRKKREKTEELNRIQKQLTGGDDRLNPRKENKIRAVRAEEALIAYLILNPDMVRSVCSELPPEKMITEFNRRVYSTVTYRILSGRSATLTDISGEFSQEENARIASILANNTVETNSPQSCREYVDIILSEGEKKSAEDIAKESPEEIQAYFEKLRADKKKKKQ